MDSGSGNHVCAKDDAPECEMHRTSHPGFRNASGGSIPAQGEIDVDFVDTQINKGGNSRFIVGPVKRPLFSTGRICDKQMITIFSSNGCFVVSESDARPIVEQLIPKSKLTFKRDATTNGLYVLDARLATPFPRPVPK